MADYQIVTPDFVNVQISTSKDDYTYNEKRFSKDITISDLKAKLELLIGASCSTMQIELYDKDNKFICKVTNDDHLLGLYPIENGMRLHIIDNFAIRKELDFGNVEKYELNPETYAKKTNTVRAFLIKNKLGQYDKEYMKKKEQQEEEEKKMLDSMIIGSRCRATTPNAPTRIGTIMYKGKIEGMNGHFVGVKFDEPLGKNDGSCKGKKYFECPPNYGAFVKVQHVLCGDFPEENYDLQEEI